MRPEEIRSLCATVFPDGKPADFVELIKALFACTVLKTGQTLVDFGEGTDKFVGARLGRTLLLNNGEFLKFFMKYRFEKGAPLTIIDSVFQYQLDDTRFSKDFIFRYDYNVNPANNHPVAHLQINGTLKHAEVSKSALPELRFPVNRPSVESMLRLLITDFGFVPNDEKNWEECLHISETAFLDYQAQKRLHS